jgi:hypothetical protein
VQVRQDLVLVSNELRQVKAELGKVRHSHSRLPAHTLS